MPIKIITAPSFHRDYQKLPTELQRATDKQIEFLYNDRFHPSLRLKKIRSHKNTWEARVSKGYRILFEFEGDTMTLHRVGPHDILQHPV